MGTAFSPVTTNLISAKAASNLVPYSRDYIARIAREGKIQAVQIDRQWFVEETSLKNFYEQSLLEDVVRKQHLSLKRKLDLEIKESYQSRLKTLDQKRATAPTVAVIIAALVLVGGMSSGLWFLGGDSSAYLASLSSVKFQTFPQSEPQPAVPVKNLLRYAAPSDVEESTRELSLRDGIVLLPSATNSQQVAAVVDLFSDNVAVTMTGTSTGIIEVEQAGVVSTLPFVRIPEQTTKVRKGTSSVGSDVTP